MTSIARVIQALLFRIETACEFYKFKDVMDTVDWLLSALDTHVEVGRSVPRKPLLVAPEPEEAAESLPSPRAPYCTWSLHTARVGSGSTWMILGRLFFG